MKKNNKINKIDHRTLNKNLEIFFFNEQIGQGLPILLKNGVIIRDLIKNFIKRKEREYGCEEVISPILADPNIYEKSGHFFHYNEYIFPSIEKDKEKFQLRPMTCPHHCLIYKRKIHSYRDLPVWISEHSILHRFEPSGSLKGLERVRWMELSDNHIFTKEEDLKFVFKKCFNFIKEVLEKFDIKIERFVCSLYDINKKDKYHDDIDIWNKSESFLLDSLNELKINFVKIEGEAAFYGPKLDIDVKANDGKIITLSTIQFDFLLPRKFDLNYIDNQGEKKLPVIVHYSAIGTYQRFIAILIEQFEGKLPFWLSPIQFVIIPIFNNKNKDKVLEFCENLKNDLFFLIRVEIWKEKRLKCRIKRIFELKIPTYVIIGDNELNNNSFLFYYDYSRKEKKVFRNELFSLLEEMNKI